MTSTEDVVVVAGEPVAPVAPVAAVKPGRARPVAVARASAGQAATNAAVAAGYAAGFAAAQNPALAAAQHADQVSWEREAQQQNAPLDVLAIENQFDRHARHARYCSYFCPCGED